MNSTPPEVGIEKEYSQGVCEDGAAILCNGQPLTIEEILRGLRERDEAHGKLEALESQESVASKEFGKWAWLESLHEMPNGSRLYTKPVPADKPAVAVPDEWRRIVERAANIMRMSGAVSHKDSLNPLHSWLHDAESLLANRCPSHESEQGGAV